MTWQIEEQDFNADSGPGRITVDLTDGVTLSILSSERNEFIREQKMWSPSALAGGWEITDVQADEGNYEIGLCDTDGEFLGVRLDPEPEGWAVHARDIDGWIYVNMTGPMIEAVVNERKVP